MEKKPNYKEYHYSYGILIVDKYENNTHVKSFMYSLNNKRRNRLLRAIIANQYYIREIQLFKRMF